MRGTARERRKEGWREAKKEVNLFPREFLDPRGGTLSCELSRDARSQRSSHHKCPPANSRPSSPPRQGEKKQKKRKKEKDRKHEREREVRCD